jgi:hypothetical protein
MSATCAAGKKVVGGGYNNVTGATVINSGPTGVEDTWTVDFSAIPTTATVTAICVTAV